MIDIEFIHEDEVIPIKCKENERLKDVYKKIAVNIPINLNLIYFTYNNDKINDKLAINQFINVKDKQKNKMKIIINSIDEKERQNENIKRKEILCPKCGKSINIKIKDYKILLYDCKYGHKFDKILFEEFPKTQKFEEPDIL